METPLQVLGTTETGNTFHNAPVIIAHQATQNPRPPAHKYAVTDRRMSSVSNSSGTRSSSSFEGVAKPLVLQPSSIPRATKAASQARLRVLASSRPSPPVVIRSKTSPSIPTIATLHPVPKPRLVSTPSPRPKNIFEINRSDNKSSLAQTPPHEDYYPRLIPDHAAPERVKMSTPEILPPRLIPELKALAANTHPHTAPSTVSTISSPSTRFTGSPTPWGTSTAATTPVSWSSSSPGIIQPARSPAHNHRAYTVPMPTAHRAQMPKLPVLPESLTASNSSSKTDLRTDTTSPGNKLRKKSIRKSPAPTPPPRSSSVKRTNSSKSKNSTKSEGRASSAASNAAPPLPDDTCLVSSGVVVGQASSEHLAHLKNIQSPHSNLQDALHMSSPKPPGNRRGKSSHIRRPEVSIDTSVVHNATPTQLLSAAPVSADSQQSTPSITPSSARSRLAKFSKFALFGRPKDTGSEDESRSQPRKLQRKGPTAGTGHEGYGKYRPRGRRPAADGTGAATDSEESVASTTRKPFSSSTRKDRSLSSRGDRTSQSDLDEFAASRLKPIVIKGGSQKNTDMTRNLYGQSRNLATSSELSLNSITSDTSRQFLDPPLDVLFKTKTIDTINDSDDEYASFRPPVLVDSVQSSENVHRLPAHRPGANSALPQQSYINSWNTSQSSLAPSSIAVSEASYDHGPMRDPDHLLTHKKSRKLRWNPFRRKQSDSAPEPPHFVSSVVDPAAGMAVSVSAIPIPRQIPYYAMVDSEAEETEIGANELVPEATRRQPVDEADFQSSIQRAESILLPAAPRRDTESSMIKDNLNASVLTTDGSSLNLSQVGSGHQKPRLAHVGRIPKVVSSHQPQQRNRMSFSRPFLDAERAASRSNDPESSQPSIPPLHPALQVRTDILPSRPFYSPDSGKPASAPIASNTRQLYPPPADIFFRSDGYLGLDRQSITSSSSDGMISVMGPPLLPRTESSQSTGRTSTAEEDIWDEYNDLLDQVTIPARLRRSTRRIEREQIPSFSGSGLGGLVPWDLAAPSLTDLAKGLAIESNFGSVPIIYEPAEAGPQDNPDHEIRLRRSRIVSALHSSIGPTSPFSIRDYFPDHESSRDSGMSMPGVEEPSSSTARNCSPGKAPSQPLPPVPPSKHHENELQINEIERSRNPIQHAELSFASLMVSRWLSFGRVLFSPAHAEIHQQPQRHVLVIDGLGNEDWSIYCAVTYQAEKAIVYDLKEKISRVDGTSGSYTANTPPNFRRRSVASFDQPFNFPDSFFSAIVVRFPHVMAETKLRNMISECRRVLAPGGYMELMLLDIDLVNMGIATRRALRELKTKIAHTDHDLSLRPMIDGVQSVLGENGFPSLNRCVVGVPVVGKPPGSADSPVSSRSSDGSEHRFRSPTAGPRPFEGTDSQQSQNFSLHDLVADHSDTADAEISKLVSRTARRWWQHCFEAAVISDGNLKKSILSNKQVLGECKARASSFKLLIAYTHKPHKLTLPAKRRTMSEGAVVPLILASSS